MSWPLLKWIAQKCIRPKRSEKSGWRYHPHRDEMRKAYDTLQKHSGFKRGDKVRILRKAEPYELGWNDGWSERMDKFVGRIGEVKDVCQYGVGVWCEGGTPWSFPWFVLELVESAPDNPTEDLKRGGD